jgi:hypothetical protein
VQVDPIKSTLNAPGTKRSELIYDGPLSNFAFNFNLRRYIVAYMNVLVRTNAVVMKYQLAGSNRPIVPLWAQLEPVPSIRPPETTGWC